MKALSKMEIEEMVKGHKQAERRMGVPYGNYGIQQVEYALKNTHAAPSTDLQLMANVLQHFKPAVEARDAEAQGQFNVAIAQVLIHHDPIRAINESRRHLNTARRDRDNWMRMEDVVMV